MAPEEDKFKLESILNEVETKKRIKSDIDQAVVEIDSRRKEYRQKPPSYGKLENLGIRPQVDSLVL